MDIIYLGHSSFRITGKTGSVVTDPYDEKMLGLKYPKVDADIVTVSHDHPDHNQSSIVGNVHKVVNGPGEYEIRGISILGYPSFHDPEKGSLRGKNTIYVFEIDGFRVAHLGDLGHTLSEDLVRELGNIDILLIPVGGEFTIGPKEAVTIVKDIEPTIIIPMHYQVPGLSEDIFAKLAPVDTFLSELGVTAERLPKFSVKEGTLSEEQKVVVLSRK